MLDLAQRRTNPIVDRYVTTDLPLLTILQNTPTPRPPLVLALVQIEECLLGRRLAKDVIAMAQSVPMKGSDLELFVLMLSSWAELSCRIGRPSEAQALLHRAKALVSEDTHPEVRGRMLLVESLHADATGNKAKSEAMLKDILSFLSERSPRRKFYVWELALLLCQQGRGIECQTDMRGLPWQCNDQFRMLRVLLLQFVDAVEAGRVHEAYPIVSQIAASSPEHLRELSRVPYRAYQALLRLMQERGVEEIASLFGKNEVADLPNWIKVVRCLLAGNTEEALHLARLEANKSLTSIFGGGFDSFNLIRAELASGKFEGALRLLKMRQERGNKHYLDDLFFARAESLAGNRSAASRRFADALKAVEFYRARGRLDFELRLSRELSHGDLVQLTRAADKVALREPAIPKPAPQFVPGERRGANDMKLDLIIGQSAAIAEVRSAISRYAELDVPVLVTGETGVGKELVARALHNLGKNKDAPFVAVNCGSIAETLLESELFGHEKGAFTGAEKANKGLFEEAGSGSIFLDEIGDVSLRLQGSLLRVLESGEIRAVGSSLTRKISCRIIAATNVDLAAASEKGFFRKDLLFRLRRLIIYLPPLRERGDDMLFLARYFLDSGRPIGVHAAISKELRETIRSYDWPGNVRELKNVIERMRLMHSDKLSYAVEDLDLKFHAAPSASVAQADSRHARGESAQLPTEFGVAETKFAGEIADRQSGAVMAIGGPKAAPVSADMVEQFLLDGKSAIRRLDRLRKLFASHKKLTRNEVIGVLRVSPNTATKDLKTLCDSGFIARVEPSSSTRSHYFVLASSQEPEFRSQNPE